MAHKVLGLGDDVRELKIGKSFFRSPSSTGQSSSSTFRTDGRSRNGQSSSSTASESFHTLKYDFKPVSVDTSQPATIDFSEDNGVTVKAPNVEGSGQPETVFSGNSRPYLKECVLIIDHETGEITLERLSSNITVKQKRAEGQPRVGQSLHPTDANSQRKSPIHSQSTGINYSKPNSVGSSSSKSPPDQQASRPSSQGATGVRNLPSFTLTTNTPSPASSSSLPNTSSPAITSRLSESSSDSEAEMDHDDKSRPPAMPVTASHHKSPLSNGHLSSSSSSSSSASSSSGSSSESDEEEGMDIQESRDHQPSMSNGFSNVEDVKMSSDQESSDDEANKKHHQPPPSMPNLLQLNEDLCLSESASDSD